MKVHVRVVGTLDARLQWQVDGRVVKTIDLPDRDGKSEAMVREPFLNQGSAPLE